jgi:hypothetical protein
MSRVASLLAAASLAAAFAAPAFADPASNNLGLPIAPNGGKASIHQWGGIDDAFAVNPDGDEAPAKNARSSAPLAQNQDDEDGADADDPGADQTDEVLPI